MQHLRLKTTDTTPQYEDAGLFAGDVCEVPVELVPVFHVNKRDDLLVRGFVKDRLKLQVMFAGRRMSETKPLIETLKTTRIVALKDAAMRAQPAPDRDDMRLPVRIEGTWRRRFMKDNSGWETRVYYLIAARWTVFQPGVAPRTFGTLPHTE